MVSVIARQVIRAEGRVWRYDVWTPNSRQMYAGEYLALEMLAAYGIVDGWVMLHAARQRALDLEALGEYWPPARPRGDGAVFQ